MKHDNQGNTMDHVSLDKEIRAAVRAHVEWNRRLATAINLGSCETAPSEIAADNLCDFGRWLYAEEMDSAIKNDRPYQVTRHLHADFHEVAARVATFAEQGKQREAYLLLDGEYSEKSSKLMRALTKWRGELEL